MQQKPAPVANDPREASETSEDIFTPFIAEWEALHPDRKPVTTPMSFSDIPEEGVLGVCITWRNGVDVVREIRIDRPSFTEIANIDAVAAKIIIFHELGHCELLRPHIDVLAFDEGKQIPYSLMASSLFPQTEVYTTHYGHYVEELFGGEGYLVPVGIKESINRRIIMQKGKWVGTGLIN